MQIAPAFAQPAEPVYTRAVVRSVLVEDGGKRHYIRLKLVPNGKLPFSTITFRVADPRLIAGLKDGASVQFRAERLGGENTITAIRAAAPCQRFEPCQ
ncbi:MAG: copper-binding protein [Ramlibacter sp.]|nr:copper-binding protein [Ramlibacter sp.]